MIWGEKEGISEIHIQMTYAHLETEETRRFREDFSIEELKGWYQKLLMPTTNGSHILLTGKKREMHP